MSPKFRVELHPLDNGEIVLARTKKTQLILRTLQNALFFAGAIYPTVKMASQQLRIPTKLPLFRLWFLQTIYCRV
jgi:hypothetical protein